MSEKIEQVWRLSDFLGSEESLFESTGYARIRLCRDGETTVVRLPVSTRGVAEVMEERESTIPRPPRVEHLVKRDSLSGEALGLDEDRVMLVPDFVDEDYVTRLREHNNRTAWLVAAAGLDLDGEWNTWDLETKVAFLKNRGMTREQLKSVYESVTALTRLNEARTDFLSGNG